METSCFDKLEVNKNEMACQKGHNSRNSSKNFSRLNGETSHCRLQNHVRFDLLTYFQIILTVSFFPRQENASLIWDFVIGQMIWSVPTKVHGG